VSRTRINHEKERETHHEMTKETEKESKGTNKTISDCLLVHQRPFPSSGSGFSFSFFHFLCISDVVVSIVRVKDWTTRQ